MSLTVVIFVSLSVAECTVREIRRYREVIELGLDIVTGEVQYTEH